MSGSSIAYHLRMNKYVDRQLFLEALGLVELYQPLGDAAYIGMGAAYLEDFRVLHQAFGIRRMLSFDMSEWVVSRQRINRPYGFIKCVSASSGEVVDQFDEHRKDTAGADGNVVVWLDYTEADQRYEQLSELQRLASKLIHGDVFRITMNAHRINFGDNATYEAEKEAGKTEQPTLADWWNERLVEQLQDYMPPERNDGDFMTEEGFPFTLMRAIKRAVLAGLTSRPELVVEPLLAITYADGQRMLTVTGIVLGADGRAEFFERSRLAAWPFAAGTNWDNCVPLAVPHLSIRERQMIHELMYYDGWTDSRRQFAFQLSEDRDGHAVAVNQYRTHYRRYPTFAPSDIL